jgi:hypothetical protein
MKNDVLQKVFIAAIVAVLSILGTLAMGATRTMSREEVQAAVAAAKQDAQSHADTLEIKLDTIQAALWALKVDMEHERTMLEDLSHRRGQNQ